MVGERVVEGGGGGKSDNEEQEGLSIREFGVRRARSKASGSPAQQRLSSTNRPTEPCHWPSERR